MKDFFFFRIMITPFVVKIIYIIGVIGIFIAPFFTDAGMIGILLQILAGQVIWRIFCECIILAFSIHGELVRANKK